LITGDRVEVDGDGLAPRITPGAGRVSMPFRVTRKQGHLLVVPGDAAPLVAAGRLDERLFDVTTLLDDGDGDARRADVPLIVQYDTRASRPKVAAAAAVVRQLPAVGGAVVSVAKKDMRAWWDTTTFAGRGAGGPGTRALSAGYSKIWLDGRRRLALDHSAPQIGAPVAWQAGLTGKGVRVAILDSGIDATHPDLAGKVDASANFTAEASGDMVGHGTHVASIVAGTGAASGGRYRGIAPDAHLLDVKVCEQDGCPEDAILAGMQWAVVTEHAKVANMSLGGPDTPGVDPLEEAVNALSAQYGTLFVVAAGNSGPGEGSLESPGSADAALTVGAVDGQDAMADFSSRGPRLGDGGLKPDITAPGVDIVAARAAGTALGDVVDERYVRLSGTSMATPHVAGAAAVLVQEHPDWGGERLKSVLMGSAKVVDGVGVFDQGAGRVDVAKAIGQTLAESPASVGFGVARWPHEGDQVLSRVVTYRNTGSVDVALDLVLRVNGADGASAPASLFSVSPDHVVVPAGGAKEVTVTADTGSDQVPAGRFSGRLVAAGAGGVVSTPVAVEKESEHYDVRITHIGRDGAAPGSYLTFLDRIGDCGMDPDCGGVVAGPDQESTLRLPPGQYEVGEFSTTAGRNDMSFLVMPVLDVRKDTSLVVDARRAKPVDMTVPHASARLMQWDFHMDRDLRRPVQTIVDFSVGGDYTTPLYTADLGGKPAAKGDLVGIVQGRFAEPGSDDQYTDSPYDYNMARSSSGRLFTGARLHPRQQDFATVETDFALASGQSRDYRTNHGATPIGTRPELLAFGPTEELSRIVATLPGHRTEYYLAKGLRWGSSFFEGDRTTGALDLFMGEDEGHVYQPGRTYRQTWNKGVFGPRLRQPRFSPTNSLANGVMRQGDRFLAGIDKFVDSGAGHIGEPKLQAGTAKLYRDGELIQDWPSFTYVAADLPPQAATYRLDTTVVTPPTLQISTEVTTSWTFRSGHVAGDQAVALPLLGVRYEPDLDQTNHARPGKNYRIPIELARQPQAGTATITKVTLDVSYDEGRTWHPAPVTHDHDHWLATVDNPSAGSVSLRVHAQDTDGNGLDQTTIRAYLVNR
jgi:subtilisin family serine protease